MSSSISQSQMDGVALLKKRAQQSLASQRSGGLSQPLKKRKVAYVEASMKQAESAPSFEEAEIALQAALERMSYEEKAEYLEACKNYPELVEKESDPKFFLRREGLNAEAAADRLVSYWRERKAVFGDRAYRPIMSLSQTDALNDEDVATLSSGLIAKLPDDVHGRSVLCVDRARSDKPDALLNQSWARCVFYWLSIVASNEKSQSEGFVLMRIVKNPNEDQARFMKILNLVKDIMPVKIADFHLCCIPPHGAMRTFTETIIPVSRQIYQDYMDKKAFVHLAKRYVDWMLA
jgi:hypothetical protein